MACLPQALALRWLLAREGMPAMVVIGVRKDAGALEAHAWVELDGLALGEPADVRERFQVMQAPAMEAA
jgi:aryl-alcohol dehydrogenase-like predicted oxidoreductase